MMFKDEQGVLGGPLAAELAAEYGVNTAISPHDYIMNAIVWSAHGEVGLAYRHYIDGGRNDARQVKAAFDACPPEIGDERPEVLDFAAGYGRVGRHFATVMPEADYTAMDIHVEAVRFNREVLGLDSLVSYADPERVGHERQFDHVFALSFFSHVRREHILPWLNAMHRLVRPGGTVMFTAHGETSLKSSMKAMVMDDDGYGMAEHSEQHDLSTDIYVHAVTLKPFMERMIADVPGLELVSYQPGAWWGEQDMYVLRSVAEAEETPLGRKLMVRARNTLGHVKRRIKGEA